MKMRSVMKLALTIAISSLLIPPAYSTLKEGRRLIPFSLKDINGDRVTVKVEKGELVVIREGPDGKRKEVVKPDLALLDFWATWCPPCRLAVPHMQKIHEKYFLTRFQGEKMKAKEKKGGIAVIGIGLDRSGAKAIKPFAEENKLNYILLSDPVPPLRDKKVITSPMKLALAYKVRGIPTMYIVDSKGIIRKVHVGFAPGMEKGIEEEIKKLLPKKP